MPCLNVFPQLFALGINKTLQREYTNTALYANNLPPGIAFPYWEDLVASNSSQQGIYYQIDISGANTQLSVEYILTTYQDIGISPSPLIQFILTYDTDAPALFSVYYFSIGDGGPNATIGVQGLDSSQSKLLDIADGPAY